MPTSRLATCSTWKSSYWCAVVARGTDSGNGAATPLPTKRVLTLDAARRVAAAAEAEATRNNWAVSIAVLDDAGHLVVFHRMDGAKLVAIDIAIRKARTAVYFQGPTKASRRR